MLKVHHMRHEAHFTILANSAIRDGRLSGLARSVLMELISRPPGWQTNADEMWKKARRDRGDRAEGRRAFRSAFAELEEFGYLIRKRERHGNRFETVMHLFHLPQDGNAVTDDVTDEDQDADDLRGTGSGTSETGTSQSGTSETGTSLRRTEDGSTDVRSTEEEESSELADARSGSIASDQAREIDRHQEQQQEAELHRRYNLVRQLTPEQLREALYAFEKKRPSIYRKCRQQAIDQYQELGQKASAHHVDQLSYMYAVAHYSNGLMPLCLSKPLGVAA